jgi:hypothetical protein
VVEFPHVSLHQPSKPGLRFTVGKQIGLIIFYMDENEAPAWQAIELASRIHAPWSSD